MDVGLGLAAAFSCLAILALTAAAESWLTTSPHPGPGAGFWQDSLHRVLRSTRLWRSTITLARSLALGGYATIIAFLALRALGPNRWGIAGVVVMGLVVVLATEWLLWALVRRHLQGAASLLLRPFLILTWAMAPLKKGLDLALIRPFNLRSPSAHSEAEAAQDMPSFLGMEAAPGAIEQEEREMIRGVMELEAKSAREVMVPRVDIFALEAQTSVAEAVDPVVQEGYSRVPVYQGTIDNIVGIVYVKDLLRALHQGHPNLPLKELARPVLFVPDSKKVDDLLSELRQRRVHIAIVADEYGGTAGLVTLEDLVEEIVGEIQDEYDVEEPLVEKISPSEAILNGRASLHDLSEALGLDFHGEDYDTVGGLLIFHLRRLAAPGDEVTLDKVTFRVLSTRGRRVWKVKVTREPPKEPLASEPPSPAAA